MQPAPTILPVTAENLQRLETTTGNSKMMVEEEEEEEERVMMSRRMESGAGIDLSLPITSTYLRRMRGLGSEPKVNNFIIFPCNVGLKGP